MNHNGQYSTAGTLQKEDFIYSGMVYMCQTRINEMVSGDFGETPPGEDLCSGPKTDFQQAVSIPLTGDDPADQPSDRRGGILFSGDNFIGKVFQGKNPGTEKRFRLTEVFFIDKRRRMS